MTYDNQHWLRFHRKFLLVFYKIVKDMVLKLVFCEFGVFWTIWATLLILAVISGNNVEFKLNWNVLVCGYNL